MSGPSLKISVRLPLSFKFHRDWDNQATTVSYAPGKCESTYIGEDEFFKMFETVPVHCVGTFFSRCFDPADIELNIDRQA